MGVYRLYTGSDGESHIEELSADAVKEIKLAGASMNFSVSQREPGHFSDYHPAPFRRWQVGVVGADYNRAERRHFPHLWPGGCASD